MKKTKKKKIVCSFCGLSHKEVSMLIEGNDSYICNFCIVKSEILFQENQATLYENKLQLKYPSLIKAELDKFIIDQEKAKKIVSVAVYNHYKRLNCLQKNQNIQIDKSNILLVSHFRIAEEIFLTCVRISL